MSDEKKPRFEKVMYYRASSDLDARLREAVLTIRRSGKLANKSDLQRKFIEYGLENLETVLDVQLSSTEDETATQTAN